jgi:pyridoxal phosphate enzyme (YggS family)
LINQKNLDIIDNNIKSLSPNSKLIIVTKNQSKDDIQTLINLGYRNFAENRVQEAKSKYTNLSLPNELSLDLIGPLQTNKVQDALELFDTIQTIDRKKLVDEIHKNILKKKTIKTKNFFIQINIGDEPQKSGVNLDNFDNFYNFCLTSNLKISGIMCIPPFGQASSKYFQQMKDITSNYKELKLSMGMSNDYVLALKFNTNYIRIGSLIFDK